MASQKTLVNQVRSATLSKVLPAMIAACLIIATLTLLFINLQVNRQHRSYIEDYEQQYDYVISTLEGQVQALARNDLIINSLIDFSNRDSYLPVLFRSLRPAHLRETDNEYSFAFTDFEGELITGNNVNAFNAAREQYDWIRAVLEMGQSFSQLNKNGLLIVHPVLYNGSPEGAIALYIPSFASVMRFEAIDYNALLFDQEALVYQSNESNSKGTTSRSELTASNLVLSSHATKDGLQLFIAEPYFSAYRDAGWISLFMILTLATIFGASVLAIGSASNIANSIIERLRSQVNAASDHSGTFKKMEAMESEPAEISELRDTFNALLEELLDTTYIKERVEGIINSLDDMLVVFGLDGEKLISNSAYEKLCEFVQGDQIESARRLIFPEGFVIPEESGDSKELTHINPCEHEERIVSWHRTIYKGADGQVVGIVLAGVDITESVALQQELRLKTQAVDEAQAPIIIADAVQKGFPITYVNRAFEKQTGYTLEEVSGSSCGFLQGKGTSPEAIKKINNELEQYKPVTTTILNYRKNGTKFYNQLSLTPIRDKNNNVTHMLGFQVDVTDQENAKQFLQQAKRKAEESAQLKSEFLASMSHEIRTPMNGILGMLGLLDATTLTKQQEHHVKLAKSSADALLTLINDILDFSKIEAGKLALESIPIDLFSLLSDVASSTAYGAEEKGLELVLDLSGAEIRRVYGDPGRIRQILTNLIGNAIKFTNYGHVLIKAESYAIDEERGALTIHIIDTGVGIPEERKKSIFESFSQADASTTRKYGGTGLGLTISKQLTTLMDGEISVESELDKGSTFTLRLETQLYRTNDSDSATQARSAPEFKLAYFDQSEVSRTSVLQQLQAWQVDVYAEAQQPALLEEIAKHSFDALIFCSTAPVDDAATFISCVRKASANSAIKVAMVTTLTELQQSQHLNKLALDTYFAKPITPDNLNDALASFKSDQPDTSSSDDRQAPRIDSGHSDVHGASVLLVEDNPTNQILAVTLLEGLGLSVGVADHGQDALNRLNQTKKYQLIFMDCHMPQMDGYEATREIRSGFCGNYYENIPIVAMTANALTGDRQACLDAGMDDYISKPIDTHKLETTIIKWLSASGDQSAESRAVNSKAIDNTENSEATMSNDKEIPDAQDNTPTWDQEEALQRAVGRPDILCKIIDAYLIDTPNIVKELETATENHNVKGIQFSAHAIKGASLNLSATEVSALAAQIERDAKQDDLTAASSSVAKLVEKSYALFQDLAKYKDKNSA